MKKKNPPDAEVSIERKQEMAEQNNEQLLKLLERMAELAKEILSSINNNNENIGSIIDECADVEALLDELKRNYKIENAVKEKSRRQVIKKSA